MDRAATRDTAAEQQPRRLWELARLPFEYVAFYFCMLFFGVGGILFTLLAAILFPLLPRAVGERAGQWIMTALFRIFLWFAQILGVFRVDVSALEELRDDKSVVIAPNHPSMLDAVLIISKLPRVVCIMKAQIWDNIFLGGGSRLAGYIRNDSPVNMIKASVAKLQEGQQLLVFPEGTRTRRGPINEFKGGFALIAQKAGASVQSVFVEIDSPFLNKGWPFFKKPELPVTYRVRLGRRFTVGEDVRKFLVELEQYFRQELGGGPR